MTSLLTIAGPSCSGKTTVAREIARLLGERNAPVVPMDAYYADRSHLPPRQRDRCNFDHPDALDWPLLLAHLDKFAQGRSVQAPVYDFRTHCRTEASISVAPGQYVLLDGLFGLWAPGIRESSEVKVYVDLELDRCLARRIARDVAERGRSETSVREQYERHVKPMAEKYVLPSRKHADLVVRGDAPPRDSAEEVLERLRALRTRPPSTRVHAD